jgi:transposase
MAVVAPIDLTPEQRRDLRRQQRRALGRVAERIHYVLLFSRGFALAEIARLYEVDERTVVAWLERYRRAGLAGLDDLPRSGRPRLASAAAQAEASRCLDATPSEWGAERTTWTRRLLGRHLGERLGCWLSTSSLTRLIARLGFTWGRPKLVPRPAPEGELPLPQMQAIIEAGARLFPEAPLLFGDECEVHQLPVVRGAYQRKGEQRHIPTPGTNAKQPIFGFLNARTGEWHYFLTPRRRSREFIECLREMERHYPEGPLLLFVDNGSIHKSERTLCWLERHPRWVVLYLPSYSAHRSNPVEKVWWALKGQVAANELYPSLEAVQDAIHGFFARFSKEAALQLCGRRWSSLPRLAAPGPESASLACAA